MRVRVHTEPPRERVAFGAAVRELRGRRGLSLAQLGERAQIHDGYLRAVERADVEPGLRTMGRIAAGLELSLSTLLVCAERRERADGCEPSGGRVADDRREASGGRVGDDGREPRGGAG